uniref:Uncharacterized protein n=1 Tax=Romanomermis culicivorax TaxID=13658 RepID=A0A915L3N2_ROMCU
MTFAWNKNRHTPTALLPSYQKLLLHTHRIKLNLDNEMWLVGDFGNYSSNNFFTRTIIFNTDASQNVSAVHNH